MKPQFLPLALAAFGTLSVAAPSEKNILGASESHLLTRDFTAIAASLKRWGGGGFGAAGFGGSFGGSTVTATSDDDSDDSSDASSAAAATSAPAAAATTASSSSSSDDDDDSSSSSSTSGSVTTAASVSTATSGGSLPASSGTSALSAVKTIAAGESFDGGMIMYDRGVDCTGQDEGGDSDAVFMLENGASLSNVIIGPNQIEGIHCEGACTLTNVWWSAVCEDAFTVKEQDSSETTYISGGGAFNADDKVIQHNGAGTISISDFTVDTFGKLYRSCGNCDDMYERHVIIDGVSATSGSELAGINENYGDSATITNTVATDVDDICVTYEGNDTGDEPTEVSTGNDGTYCIYSSDVTSAK